MRAKEEKKKGLAKVNVQAFMEMGGDTDYEPQYTQIQT